MEKQTFERAKSILEEIGKAEDLLSFLMRKKTGHEKDEEWMEILSIAYEAVKFKRDVYSKDFREL